MAKAKKEKVQNSTKERNPSTSKKELELPSPHFDFNMDEDGGLTLFEYLRKDPDGYVEPLINQFKSEIQMSSSPKDFIEDKLKMLAEFQPDDSRVFDQIFNYGLKQTIHLDRQRMRDIAEGLYSKFFDRTVDENPISELYNRSVLATGDPAYIENEILHHFCKGAACVKFGSFLESELKQLNSSGYTLYSGQPAQVHKPSSIKMAVSGYALAHVYWQEQDFRKSLTGANLLNYASKYGLSATPLSKEYIRFLRSKKPKKESKSSKEAFISHMKQAIQFLNEVCPKAAEVAKDELDNFLRQIS